MDLLIKVGIFDLVCENYLLRITVTSVKAYSIIGNTEIELIANERSNGVTSVIVAFISCANLKIIAIEQRSCGKMNKEICHYACLHVSILSSVAGLRIAIRNPHCSVIILFNESIITLACGIDWKIFEIHVDICKSLSLSVLERFAR